MSAARPNVLLGVCGSIAAYKSAVLVRELRRAECEVRVVMSAAARAFITELTLHGLAGRPVESDAFDAGGDNDNAGGGSGSGMKHIDLAQWADLVLVAPASANLLAKLAHGLADDLLSMTCLAASAPVAVAPAMNRGMWENPATRANVACLRERGVLIWGPAAGDQACGDSGAGRMIEADDIVARLRRLFGDRPLQGCTVVVTAGPTREALDPVRCLTNHSSGRMGFAMAQAACDLGADVTLIAGPVALATPTAVAGALRRMDVISAADMAAAARAQLTRADVFIACAAVSDYRPAAPARRKIKKSAYSSGGFALELVETEDILTSAGRRHPHLFRVGFAAETEAVEANAKAKLLKKNLDVVVANRVGAGDGYGFDGDDNQVDVYWRGGGAHLDPAPKTELAERLMRCIVARYRETAHAREQSDTA